MWAQLKGQELVGSDWGRLFTQPRWIVRRKVAADATTRGTVSITSRAATEQEAQAEGAAFWGIDPSKVEVHPYAG